MAFPVPAHLPRGKDPQDVSTRILTKVSETDAKALNASLASSWVAELDETIAQTKVRCQVGVNKASSRLTLARSLCRLVYTSG